MLVFEAARSPAAVSLAFPARSIAPIWPATCLSVWWAAPEHWPSRNAGPAMTTAPTTAGHHIDAALRAAIHSIMAGSPSRRG